MRIIRFHCTVGISTNTDGNSTCDLIALAVDKRAEYTAPAALNKAIFDRSSQIIFSQSH